MELILLIILGSLSITTAVMVITSKNMIHSALWMIGSFFYTAVIYFLLHAELIAILQIIVYAGAIMTFIIYSIMMINIRSDERARLPSAAVKVVGLAFLCCLFLLLLPLMVFGVKPGLVQYTGLLTDRFIETYGYVQIFANYLFSDYLFPFEVTSILLTAGIVGAVVLAKKTK